MYILFDKIIADIFLKVKSLILKTCAFSKALKKKRKIKISDKWQIRSGTFNHVDIVLHARSVRDNDAGKLAHCENTCVTLSRTN